MPGSTSRRDFIIKSGKTSLGMWLTLNYASYLSSCSVLKKIDSTSKITTAYTQDALPYSYNALNDAIDAATMEIH